MPRTMKANLPAIPCRILNPGNQAARQLDSGTEPRRSAFLRSLATAVCAKHSRSSRLQPKVESVTVVELDEDELRILDLLPGH